MINRHTTLFVKDIKPIESCGKLKIWKIDIIGTFEKPFETQPTKGEHDFNTCEGCQGLLKELRWRLTEKFEGTHKDGAKPFPFCCTGHSELTKLKEFNRAEFVGVPEMVAKKIIYTVNHVKNNHQSTTFYKDITDYIDYTVESFGKMPGGGEPLFLSDYFFYLTVILGQSKKIENERKNKILKYLKVDRTPIKKPKTDFNILMATYQKWVKIFPFDISFFAHLKPHFEKLLPLLKGKPEVNKYSGTVKFKAHSKVSLINSLLNLTNSLLTQINTATLYEKGLLTEPQKIKLELILNERKMKLKQGYVNNTKDEEQRYRKILKEWFADEKRFIDEVIPFVESLPPQTIIKEANQAKYQAKHYVLAYLFECNAKGISYPRGIKKDLERIGNERMGAGKGNRFYKVFNEIINKDLNVENDLIEIGGHNWRTAVIELSNESELVEKYLQNKQL